MYLYRRRSRHSGFVPAIRPILRCSSAERFGGWFGSHTGYAEHLPDHGCGVGASEGTDCSRLEGRFWPFLGGTVFFEGWDVPFLPFASFGLSLSGFGHSISRSKSIRETGTHSSRRLLKLSKLQ